MVIESQRNLIYDFFRKNDSALLVVLDACRPDTLSTLRPQWNVSVVRSEGSATREWLTKTFVVPLKDVVYISSNPFAYVVKNVREMFKRVVDLYMFCWDNRLHTVRPNAVNLFVKENMIAGERKMIAHYMQPHPPFLTNTWLNSYVQEPEEAKRRRSAKEPSEACPHKGLVALGVYKVARRSFQARKEFKRAYTKNLAEVLKYVESLTKDIRSTNKHFQIALTSDHSEIFGIYAPFKFKRKFWLWIPLVLGIHRYVGHSSKSWLRKLYEVPWAIL